MVFKPYLYWYCGLESTHLSPLKFSKMSTCSDCGEHLPLASLKQHRSRFHSKNLKCGSITLLRANDNHFHCTLCDASMNDYTAMQNHLRRSHQDELHGSNPGPAQQPLGSSSRPAPYPPRNIRQPSLSQSRSIRGSQARENLVNRLFSSSSQALSGEQPGPLSPPLRPFQEINVVSSPPFDAYDDIPMDIDLDRVPDDELKALFSPPPPPRVDKGKGREYPASWSSSPHDPISPLILASRGPPLPPNQTSPLVGNRLVNPTAGMLHPLS